MVFKLEERLMVPGNKSDGSGINFASHLKNGHRFTKTIYGLVTFRLIYGEPTEGVGLPEECPGMFWLEAKNPIVG